MVLQCVGMVVVMVLLCGLLWCCYGGCYGVAMVLLGGCYGVSRCCYVVAMLLLGIASWLLWCINVVAMGASRWMMWYCNGVALLLLGCCNLVLLVWLLGGCYVASRHCSDVAKWLLLCCYGVAR